MRLETHICILVPDLVPSKLPSFLVGIEPWPRSSALFPNSVTPPNISLCIRSSRVLLGLPLAILAGHRRVVTDSVDTKQNTSRWVWKVGKIRRNAHRIRAVRPRASCVSLVQKLHQPGFPINGSALGQGRHLRRAQGAVDRSNGSRWFVSTTLFVFGFFFSREQRTNIPPLVKSTDSFLCDDSSPPYRNSSLFWINSVAISLFGVDWSQSAPCSPNGSDSQSLLSRALMGNPSIAGDLLFAMRLNLISVSLRLRDVADTDATTPMRSVRVVSCIVVVYVGLRWGLKFWLGVYLDVVHVEVDEQLRVVCFIINYLT